ncbi:hypothetical protein GJW-30_1_01418 [Variibacter gotjawalensis]|uniref:TIR domain-containing protein n=1 Tax=Variibacter gotjawalensis TaxID=1333996 RepID=A0A0S3PSH5_9BRAD|nr:toll/interleukin-1 receptor domain-containing protein [Variibacter gotjawalensis]NIK49202.1 hypothetical protein [Variibacter gotjawalensis]RZS51056.1 TIR domain-containing protein [Variibacter gotjawalensis]BAT58890.1 hypothetical protein GJW-30_1_01418 [Variibacter gotjawalensis]
MADIFISYKKEDAGRVIRLVETLRAEGFSVWWDHGIKAGSEWDRAIRSELDAARLVIAVWSNASVSAIWVKEEANFGKNRGILLPVKIDNVDPPFGFTMIQAADLVGWAGDREDPRWDFLMHAVREQLSGETPATFEAPLRQAPKAPTPPPQSSSKTAIIAIAAVLLLVLIGGAIALFTLGGNRQTAVPTPAPAPPPVVAAPTPPPQPQITENEQKLWDQAFEAKTRQGFQTYLVSYPNGAYAQRARDILLTCRSEQREGWKPGPDVANQMLRGVGDTTSGMSQPQACQKAKDDVIAMAKRLCETITTNGGYRAPKWTVGDKDCECNSPNPRVTICIADLPYSCRWEMKVSERVEICG